MTNVTISTGLSVTEFNDDITTEQGAMGILFQRVAEDPCGVQWMILQERSGAFDFWNDPEEDIYTEEDGEPV